MEDIKIKLTQGKYALINKNDFEKISKYKWCYKVSKVLKSGKEYGTAIHGFWDSKRKQNKIVKLHRFILDLNDPKTLVDHINGDPLDCRRSNLRIVDGSLNNINRKNTKGYYWDKINKQWKVELGYYSKRIWVGRFNTEKEARTAYEKAVKQYYY